MPYKDPDKQKQAQHRSYLKHKEKVADRSCRRRAENRREQLSRITPCVKCGEDHPAVIDFHHVDPSTKLGTINRICLDKTIVEVKAELDKCICLCSNCHRLFHAGVIDLPSL